MLEVIAAAAFVLIERADPITLEPQAGYGVTDEGHLLMLTCRPGKQEIDINLIPSGYQGAPSGILLWSPHADSRFGSEPKPDKDAWNFTAASIVFVGQGFGYTGEKAKFLDRLASNSTLNVRFEDYPERVQTISVNYIIEPAQLRQFIALCGPKKVIKALREMKSQVAP